MKFKKNKLITFILKILGIIFRLLLFVLIIFGLIMLFEKVILKPEYITADEDLNYSYYEDIKNKTNITITEKLIPGYWNYEADDYTILKHSETIPEKGNKKRILVIGDSFVWGWAHSNINNVWWRQLQYTLNQNGYQDVEIVAAGMNGFSIVDETQKIVLNHKYIDKINPDLIIMAFISNDWEIMDDNDELIVKDLVKEFNEPLHIENNFNNAFLTFLSENFNNIYNKVIRLLLNKDYATEEFKEQYGYSYDEKKKLYLSNKYFERIEEKGIKPLSDVDIPLFVVNLHYDTNTANNSNTFKNKVFSTLDKYDIKNYDLESSYNKEFDGVNYSTLQVNIADYHPGTRLMNFYSNEIYKILKNDYPNILGNVSKFENKELKINDYMPSNIDLNKLNNNEYTFTYRYSNPNMLYYEDTLEQYTKLNFEYPINLNKIVIQSKYSNVSTLKVKYYDENLGYESEEELTLSKISLLNNTYEYMVTTSKKITSLQISCSSENNIDETIHIQFK